MDRDRATWGGVEDHLLWCYKWILEHLPEFPQVSNDQLAKTFQDMEAPVPAGGTRPQVRAQAQGVGGRADGRPAEAARFEGLWQSTQRDRLADCAACEVGTHVEYLVFAGRDEDAIAAAAPLFGGRTRCKEVPNTAFSRLLVPLLAAADSNRRPHVSSRAWRDGARAGSSSAISPTTSSSRWRGKRRRR